MRGSLLRVRPDYMVAAGRTSRSSCVICTYTQRIAIGCPLDLQRGQVDGDQLFFDAKTAADVDQHGFAPAVAGQDDLIDLANGIRAVLHTGIFGGIDGGFGGVHALADDVGCGDGNRIHVRAEPVLRGGCGPEDDHHRGAKHKVFHGSDMRCPPSTLAKRPHVLGCSSGPMR
jgi:hypothetical protein